MKSPKTTAATLPKLVSVNRYAKECGVSVQAIRERIRRETLPIVKKFDEDTQQESVYINTEQNPPVKFTVGRQPVPPAPAK